jgi:hypothetical protein
MQVFFRLRFFLKLTLGAALHGCARANVRGNSIDVLRRCILNVFFRYFAFRISHRKRFISADFALVESLLGSHSLQYSMVADILYCKLKLSGSWGSSVLNFVSSFEDGVRCCTLRYDSIYDSSKQLIDRGLSLWIR